MLTDADATSQAQTRMNGNKFPFTCLINICNTELDLSTYFTIELDSAQLLVICVAVVTAPLN